MLLDSVRKTRRNYVFPCPPAFKFATDNVKANDGFLYFDSGVFKNTKECYEWIKSGTPEDVSILKSVTDSVIKKAAINDADFELMKSMMPHGDAMTPDQFVAFDDYLAFNVVDRDMDRIPKKALKRLSDTIVTRPKLISHKWEVTGVGKYYKSKLLKVSIDEMIEMTRNPHPKYKDLLAEIEEIDKGLFWLVATYYIPEHKQEIIADVGTGLTNSSIGMMGVSYDGVYDDKGNLKYFEYIVTDRLQAVEGSFVGVESQYGAQTRKGGAESRSDKGDVSAEDNKSHRSSKGEGKHDNNINGGKLMNVEFKSLDYAVEIEELAEIKHVVKFVDDSVAVLTEQKTQAEESLKSVTEELESVKGSLNELNEIKEAMGDDLTIEDVRNAREVAKNAEAEAKQLKSDLVDEIAVMQVKAGELANEAERIEKRKAALMKWDNEELKETKTGLEKLIAEPQKPQSTRSDGEDKKEMIRTSDFELS